MFFQFRLSQAFELHHRKLLVQGTCLARSIFVLFCRYLFICDVLILGSVLRRYGLFKFITDTLLNIKSCQLSVSDRIFVVCINLSLDCFIDDISWIYLPQVSKSANYCFTSKTNNIGIMLLCEVALGNENQLLDADNTLHAHIPKVLSVSLGFLSWEISCSYINTTLLGSISLFHRFCIDL